MPDLKYRYQSENPGEFNHSIDSADPKLKDLQTSSDISFLTPTAPPINTPTAAGGRGVITSGDDTLGKSIKNATTANQQAIQDVSSIQIPTSGAIQPTMPTLPASPNLAPEIITPEAQQSLDLLKQRREQLGSEKTIAGQEISDEFAAQRKETERTNTANLEFGKAVLAGKGVLPATSSQYLQWYTETTARNQEAINSVLVSERKALNAANKAYNEADFNVASKMVEVAQQSRDRYDKLQMWQAEMNLKRAELQLNMTEFAVNTGFKADELSLAQMNFGLNKAKTMADLEFSQTQIKSTIEKDWRAEDEYKNKVEADKIDGLVQAIIPNLTENENENLKMIQDLADEYGVDVEKLYGEVETKRTIEKEKEFERDIKTEKSEEEKRQFDISNKLAQAKFEENNRQFGFEYAFKQQQLAIERGKLALEREKVTAENLKKGQPSPFSKKALNAIDVLLKHPGLEGAVGISMLPFQTFLPGSKSADFKAQANSLTSMLTLDNIKYLKGTGAITDKEQDILTGAATSLNRNIGEIAYIKELVRLKIELGGSDIPSEKGKLKENEILVIKKDNKTVGSIGEEEFDKDLYIKL